MFFSKQRITIKFLVERIINAQKYFLYVGPDTARTMQSNVGFLKLWQRNVLWVKLKRRISKLF